MVKNMRVREREREMLLLISHISLVCSNANGLHFFTKFRYGTL